MNPSQYERVLQQRVGRGRPTLLGDAPCDRLLRDAARKARRWAALETAWNALPAPCSDAQLIALEDGVLTIAARSAAERFELSRQAAALAGDLGRRVGGIRAVRVAPLQPSRGAAR